AGAQVVTRCRAGRIVDLHGRGAAPWRHVRKPSGQPRSALDPRADERCPGAPQRCRIRALCPAVHGRGRASGCGRDVYGRPGVGQGATGRAEVATGYRLQIREKFAPWVGRLWEERPQRYSRALLETMALIAYRQPITRGEIEDVRGVAVNSNIVKTLLEREWIRIVGYRDVPGKPAMFATTKAFLDHFN
nr:hypothetical protein [Tanacetum cinerariifolium]